MRVILVGLTPREREVLARMAADKDLSPARLLVRGLRVLDLIESGGAELVFPGEREDA